MSERDLIERAAALDAIHEEVLGTRLDTDTYRGICDALRALPSAPASAEVERLRRERDEARESAKLYEEQVDVADKEYAKLQKDASELSDHAYARAEAAEAEARRLNRQIASLADEVEKQSLRLRTATETLKVYAQASPVSVMPAREALERLYRTLPPGDALGIVTAALSPPAEDPVCRPTEDPASEYRDAAVALAEDLEDSERGFRDGMHYCVVCEHRPWVKVGGEINHARTCTLARFRAARRARDAQEDDR